MPDRSEQTPVVGVTHTPGPFEREQGTARGAWIQGSDGKWIALACGDDDRAAVANGEFILRALNSHYELLAAAEKALNYIANTESELGITLDSGTALRAAIAQSTGEPV